ILPFVPKEGRKKLFGSSNPKNCDNQEGLKMNKVKQATPDNPIQELIASRCSPYAFSDRPVREDDLRSLFEAARWAASSYNEQPWSYIVATKANPAEFERLLSCLVEANQPWAKAAPVLALGCAKLTFAHNGKP